MIDIIIPVYDGLKETIECIESVLSVKNDLLFNVIIINDKSPNNQITQYLDEITDFRVEVIINEKNLGFVKTVNKGMRQSKNDVILLNSDTIVTNNWIDKMYRAAYSSPKVATVTALTNNGTISSVPYFNQDNIIPEGYTLESFAKLVEDCSLKHYPIIPTAVGHAMYIKRSVLNKIGLFDEDNFGKGYCEENEFSARVIREGLLNILADDTYIYHHGSTSFKGEKLKRIKKNKKVLYKKHFWYYFTLKKFFFLDKKVKSMCMNIQNYMNRSN